MTLFCLHTTRLVELFCAKLEQSEAVCCTHTDWGENENIAFLCEGCAIKGKQELGNAWNHILSTFLTKLVTSLA